MTYEAVLVGTGGRGSTWATHVLPPFVEDGDVEFVAVPPGGVEPKSSVPVALYRRP